MKLGVEIEFWTVNNKGNLTSCEKLVNELDFAEKEFVKPLYEIKTSPHESLEELTNSIEYKIKTSIEKAGEHNLKLVPTGTPLNSGKIEALKSERGLIQQEIIGENLKHAKKVAGFHIHFEREDTVKQLNTLTALDPALSLLNSSPYYQGNPIAASSRNKIYRYRCYRDFPQHGQLWDYTESLAEWEERMQKRFSEFKQAGLKKGLDEQQIEDNFTAGDALWTPIRLRENYPTVEYRSPDTAMPSQIKLFLKDIVKAMRERENKPLPKFKKVKKLSREAIEKGKTDNVERYLRRYGFKTSEYRNKRTFTKKDSLSRKQACKIRLDEAKRMKTDLQ